jgi:hypothetical protein
MNGSVVSEVGKGVGKNSLRRFFLGPVYRVHLLEAELQNIQVWKLLF